MPWLGCFNPFLSLFIFSTEERKGWKHSVFCKGANSLHMSLSEKHVRQHEVAPGLVRCSYLATIGRVIDEHCRIWEPDLRYMSLKPLENHNRQNMKLKIQQRLEYLQEKIPVVTILFAEFEAIMHTWSVLAKTNRYRRNSVISLSNTVFIKYIHLAEDDV